MMNYNIFSKCSSPGATNSQIVDCCVKDCQPTHDWCKERCKNIAPVFNECHRQCDKSLFLCRDTCRLFNNPQFGINNVYNTCAAKHGCGPSLGNMPNPDCLKSKSQDILKCCVNDCNQQKQSNTDCNSLCNFLSKNYFNPYTFRTPGEGERTGIDVDPLEDKTKENYKGKDKDNDIALGVAITAGILLLGIFLYKKAK